MKHSKRVSARAETLLNCTYINTIYFAEMVDIIPFMRYNYITKYNRGNKKGGNMESVIQKLFYKGYGFAPKRKDILIQEIKPQGALTILVKVQVSYTKKYDNELITGTHIYSFILSNDVIKEITKRR